VIRKLFDECDKGKHQSVVLPAISAGPKGVPNNLCAKAILSAILDYVEFSKND
jgi:O-acetyl-ADP-ribose deacetylase (regulator of RNase III)